MFHPIALVKKKNEQDNNEQTFACTKDIYRDSDREFCWQLEHLKTIIVSERAEAFFFSEAKAIFFLICAIIVPIF